VIARGAIGAAPGKADLRIARSGLEAGRYGRQRGWISGSF
jgi:hypothetical protein